MAKKKGRNTRNMKTGKIVKPFTGSGVGSGFYKTPEWRAVSKAVLDRDAVCQWCAALGRVTVATQADHIIPVSRLEHEGISPFDKSNICGSCNSCNSRRAAYEARGVHLNTFEAWVNYMKTKINDNRRGV
jgi:5-methylcytosine-specific restriction endonuclease McrA